jgi:hypothetical protein
VIANANVFSFYARGANTTTGNYKAEWSIDNFGSFGGSTGALNTGGSTIYAPVTLTGFSGASNVKIRITNTSGGAIYVDDLAWTSTDLTQNTVIVPQLGNTICTRSCIS